MPSPLLSTFKTGENRVTSTTLAVFERMDLGLVLELLEKSAGIAGQLSGVSFENQVTTAESVPDARISARFSWWFETKTERGAYNAEGHSRSQLRRHAQQLDADPEAVLFVLTPDPVQPRWFENLDGVGTAVRQRVVWLSFAGIADAIDEIVGDNGRLVGEQTRFLLAELRAFYEAEGLLTNDDVVVVAARIAWNNYRSYSAYVCQPNRAFKEGLRFFGFYHAGRIEDRVPRIVRWFPAIEFSEHIAQEREATGEEMDAQLSQVIRKAVSQGARTEGETYGVMLLTAFDDEDTVRLAQPIENDTRTTTGKPWAWTLGQRYTSISKLQSGVARTSLL